MGLGVRELQGAYRLEVEHPRSEEEEDVDDKHLDEQARHRRQDAGQALDSEEGFECEREEYKPFAQGFNHKELYLSQVEEGADGGITDSVSDDLAFREG